MLSLLTYGCVRWYHAVVRSRWVRGCVQRWQRRRVIAKWMREGARRHCEVEEGRVCATLS